MEELGEGLEELKELAPHRKKSNINQPDTIDLPGTKATTKEYPWKDPGL